MTDGSSMVDELIAERKIEEFRETAKDSDPQLTGSLK